MQTQKAAEAFRTISEVADVLGVQKHVLRFWEAKFSQLRPMKRGGGRRYYRPEDLELLKGIRHLLHGEGYTIKGVQKILRQSGVDFVKGCWKGSSQKAGASSGEASEERKRAGRGLTKFAPGVAARREASGGGPAKAAGSAPGLPLDAERRKAIEAVAGELKTVRRNLTAAGKSEATAGAQTAAKGPARVAARKTGAAQRANDETAAPASTKAARPKKRSASGDRRS